MIACRRAKRITSMETKERLWRLDKAAFGAAFLGVAALLYGIACLLQDDFVIMGRPVPENLALRQALAYILAGSLVIGGAGLLRARTVRPAALLLIVHFGVYALCYLRALIGPPLETNAVMGLAEQSSVAVGAWAVLLNLRDGSQFGATAARVTFGLCSLVFALAHFVARVPTASAVPDWMPGGQIFWALATGFGHLAVGLALIANRVAVPAARMGALMYVCFVVFVWLPGAFAHPTEWPRWAGAAFSLCMAGALWTVGDLLFARRYAATTAQRYTPEISAKTLASG